MAHLDARKIDGVWRVVRERPKPKVQPLEPDAASAIRILLGVVTAIILRLVLFGPIHH